MKKLLNFESVQSELDSKPQNFRTKETFQNLSWKDDVVTSNIVEVDPLSFSVRARNSEYESEFIKQRARYCTFSSRLTDSKKLTPKQVRRLEIHLEIKGSILELGSCVISVFHGENELEKVHFHPRVEATLRISTIEPGATDGDKHKKNIRNSKGKEEFAIDKLIFRVAFDKNVAGAKTYEGWVNFFDIISGKFEFGSSNNLSRHISLFVAGTEEISDYVLVVSKLIASNYII